MSLTALRQSKMGHGDHDRQEGLGEHFVYVVHK
jgi:hypothetical protein